MTGCGMMSAPPVTVTDTFCRVYEPVCMSRKDTALTQEMVTDNEAAFKRLCPVEAQKGDRKCELLGKAAAEK